jgi:hypothetical protein
MTAGRQKRKLYRTWLAALNGLLIVLVAMPFVAAAAITERVVVDWHNGLAIDGYDPVAFFTDSKPLIGSADFELGYSGVVWRFRNVGNRAAFADNPDIYMPQFGGYDPVGVTHGVAVSGNPNVWFVASQRLFLFYDRGRQEKFAADSARFIAEAERRWPEVRRGLSP